MTLNVSLHEKLLIIGCGDIGCRLAEQLATKPYHITGLRRSAVENLPYLQYRQCDVSQPEAFTRILTEGYDVIVVSMTPSESSDSGYRLAYVDTCQHLITALNSLNKKPRLIIFVSSTSVYAQQDGSWIDETSPTCPASFSGLRLLEAERIIQHSGYPHCILRFSGIYGPGRTRLIDQVRQQRASNSTHFTNRIHADDCAGALAHLIERHKTSPIDSVYVATDNAPSPMIEVVSWIGAQLGIENVVSANATNERGNKRISNRRLLATGYQLRYPDFKEGYKALLTH